MFSFPPSLFALRRNAAGEKRVVGGVATGGKQKGKESGLIAGSSGSAAPSRVFVVAALSFARRQNERELGRKKERERQRETERKREREREGG